MFTGLVECSGSVTSWDRSGEKAKIVVKPDLQLTGEIGDSYSINGCCLTLVESSAEGLAFELGGETLQTVCVEAMERNCRVHLERAMALGDRLGGHLVSGHVDGIAEVLRSEAESGGWLLSLKIPKEFRALFVTKGSICVNGVSLTVNSLDDRPQFLQVSMLLIPETLRITQLGSLKPGARCNFEADLLAKHLQRLAEVQAKFPGEHG